MKPNNQQSTPLNRMIVREDVLQICYWYQGEGFGDRFTPQAMVPFLKNDMKIVAEVMAELADNGTFNRDGDSYCFSEQGKRKAGAMFYENFTEFQLSSHGECNAGCCDGDEVCEHEHHH